MRYILSVGHRDVESIVLIYGDMLYRLCLVMLKNKSDAEDAVQETIIKYLEKAPEFKDSEHEKAWLITVATNKCRDMLRFKQRHSQLSLDYVPEMSTNSSDSGILEALMALPEKFRMVLILYYVEGYPINDIAKMMRRTPSAVKMRLQKGRKLLEEKYRKEYL